MADTITMAAKANIDLRKFLEGSFNLLTHGEIFSHPPTLNTRIDSEVKYFKLKLGSKFFQFKLML